jgi:hypothetical protein
MGNFLTKVLNYFIQIDRGVMRDRIYLFDISTAAGFLRDTLKNFDSFDGFLCSRGGRKGTDDSLEIRQTPP